MVHKIWCKRNMVWEKGTRGTVMNICILLQLHIGIAYFHDRTAISNISLVVVQLLTHAVKY